MHLRVAFSFPGLRRVFVLRSVATGLCNTLDLATKPKPCILNIQSQLVAKALKLDNIGRRRHPDLAAKRSDCDWQAELGPNKKTDLKTCSQVFTTTLAQPSSQGLGAGDASGCGPRRTPWELPGPRGFWRRRRDTAGDTAGCSWNALIDLFSGKRRSSRQESVEFAFLLWYVEGSLIPDRFVLFFVEKEGVCNSRAVEFKEYCNTSQTCMKA